MNICVAISGIRGKMGRHVQELLTLGYEIQGDRMELVREPERENVDVWIDFTRPQGTIDLLSRIATPVVIGTTGFSDSQRQVIADYAKAKPVLVAPNLSPGINYLVKMLKESRLGADRTYSIVASETHHVHKVDSPSGTLKKLIALLQGQGRTDISVQVSRLGEIIGQHQLRFVSDCEEIVISHEVRDRRVFANGALLAAHRLVTRNEPGLYAFEDLL